MLSAESLPATAPSRPATSSTARPSLSRSLTLDTRDFGRAVSINDAGLVSGREYVKPQLSTYQIGTRTIPWLFGTMLTVPEYITLADPPQTLIRVWNPDGSSVAYAEAGGRRTPADLQNLITTGQASFTSLLNFTDINHEGQVVYTYTDQNKYEIREDLGNLTISTLPYGTFTRPLLADDGSVAYQRGNSGTSPIVIQRPNEQLTTIASASSPFYGLLDPNKQFFGGFSTIGRNPGIGSDGKAVAFMASEKVPGGSVDGIFLSLPRLGANGLTERRIYRIVSKPSGPNGTEFTSVDPKDRVAVSKVDAVGGVTASFIATDENGHRGLYTVYVSGIDTGTIQVSDVFTALRVGDAFDVPGSNNTVTSKTVAEIGVNDPLNDQGELAFWVRTTTDEQYILKATPPNIKSAPAQSIAQQRSNSSTRSRTPTLRTRSGSTCTARTRPTPPWRRRFIWATPRSRTTR